MTLLRPPAKLTWPHPWRGISCQGMRTWPSPAPYHLTPRSPVALPSFAEGGEGGRWWGPSTSNWVGSRNKILVSLVEVLKCKLSKVFKMQIPCRVWLRRSGAGPGNLYFEPYMGQRRCRGFWMDHILENTSLSHGWSIPCPQGSEAPLSSQGRQANPPELGQGLPLSCVPKLLLIPIPPCLHYPETQVETLWGFGNTGWGRERKPAPRRALSGLGCGWRRWP